jgi:hypothetical protein
MAAAGFRAGPGQHDVIAVEAIHGSDRQVVGPDNVHMRLDVVVQHGELLDDVPDQPDPATAVPAGARTAVRSL